MIRLGRRVLKLVFKDSSFLSSKSVLFKPNNKLLCVVGATGLSSFVAYWCAKNASFKFLIVDKVSASSNAAIHDEFQGEDLHPQQGKGLTHRERRFLNFASVECDGVVYMTPEDFLESVTQELPRFRRRRRMLSKAEVDTSLRRTPSTHHGSSSLFRSLETNGIISYTEYLFLLCVLTKPKSGFQIAFNMFDTDSNNEVDKSEFLVLTECTLKESFPFQAPLNRLISGAKNSGSTSEEQNEQTEGESGGAVPADSDRQQGTGADDFRLANHTQDTTLLIHFFGRHGNRQLTYKEFVQFMENLQSEVLQIEFLEYSKGRTNISESDFARILLRYTKIAKANHDNYIVRIKERMAREEGISFEEYEKFIQFLNNLDDFTLAMKMYTLADRPISQQEFQLAVKACTGQRLSPHLVETVFQIFDNDGDGDLSYQEFVHIMRDRLTRGLAHARSHAPTRWEAYRHCVSEVMREEN